MSNHESSETEQLVDILKSLIPSKSGLDRDRLMYRAGQASNKNKHRAWGVPVMTAVMGIIAGIVGTYVGFRTTFPPVERVVIVYLKEPAEQPPAMPSQNKPEPIQEVVQAQTSEPENMPSWWNSLVYPPKSAGGYVGLRDDILRWGVDMLPESPGTGYTGSGSGAASLGQLQADMLEPFRDF